MSQDNSPIEKLIDDAISAPQTAAAPASLREVKTILRDNAPVMTAEAARPAFPKVEVRPTAPPVPKVEVRSKNSLAPTTRRPVYQPPAFRRKQQAPRVSNQPAYTPGTGQPRNYYERPAAPPAPVPGGAQALLLKIFGFAFGIPLAASAVASILSHLIRFSPFSLVMDIMVLVPMAALAFYAVYKGFAIEQSRQRFVIYKRELSQNGYATVERLAKSVGRSQKDTLKELQWMQAKGFFADSYIDPTGSNFILGRENYDAYLKTVEEMDSLRQEEALILNSPGTPDAVVAEGNAFVRQIRIANEALPGAEISKKLSRLEDITTKIFFLVGKRPEKLPDIRRFMEYYLPTTLKLVGAYRDFDKQAVQSQSVLDAKQQIEESLDTINDAFANLLDQLFQKDSMDIHTEIAAMQAMLAGDGLMKSAFTPDEEQPDIAPPIELTLPGAKERDQNDSK